MPYDLALSEHGDLIFSASRDLQGVSGIALVEQRIRLRLRIPRGQWQFDADGNLGSQLFTLTGQSMDAATSHAQIYVREALRDMNEIIVDDVLVSGSSDGRSLEIHVKYHVSEDDGSTAPELNLDLAVSFPIGE